MADLHFLTAVQLSEKIKSKKISCLEMLDLFSNDLGKLKDSILNKDTKMLFSSFEKTRNVRKKIIDAGQD